MDKYYFQELCSDMQDDLIGQALENAGRYQQTLPAHPDLLEDVDDFINRHNFPQTIPEWFETMQLYAAGAEVHTRVDSIVKIEVQGGVAYVTNTPPGVAVEIVDYDNLEANSAD